MVSWQLCTLEMESMIEGTRIYGRRTGPGSVYGLGGGLDLRDEIDHERRPQTGEPLKRQYFPITTLAADNLS